MKNLIKRLTGTGSSDSAEDPSFSSGDYWERRYRAGKTSGDGSAGELASYKARTLNRFVLENNVTSIQEWGCGDGSQLDLYKYPKYVGIDVSPTVIEVCRKKFADDPSKRFFVSGEADSTLSVDMCISIDVIFHLVEDTVYEAYMNNLFGNADRFVAIYSSMVNLVLPNARHVRHRHFLSWVAANRSDWTLLYVAPNPHPTPNILTAEPGTSFCDFYFFGKR